jgi:peptidoglycan/LPS O-acetylase OafA/YrhL
MGTENTIYYVNIYYFLIIGGIPFLFKNTSKNKISNFLGELSYPIYISQEIVLNIFNNYIHFNSLNQNIITFIEILTVMIFSYMLYMVIMKPIDLIRASRLKRKAILPSSTPKKLPAYVVASD